MSKYVIFWSVLQFVCRFPKEKHVTVWQQMLHNIISGVSVCVSVLMKSIYLSRSSLRGCFSLPAYKLCNLSSSPFLLQVFKCHNVVLVFNHENGLSCVMFHSNLWTATCANEDQELAKIMSLSSFSLDQRRSWVCLNGEDEIHYFFVRKDETEILSSEWLYENFFIL